MRELPVSEDDVHSAIGSEVWHLDGLSRRHRVLVCVRRADPSHPPGRMIHTNLSNASVTEIFAH